MGQVCIAVCKKAIFNRFLSALTVTRRRMRVTKQKTEHARNSEHFVPYARGVELRRASCWAATGVHAALAQHA